MKLVTQAAILVAAGLGALAACSDEFTTKADPGSSGAGGSAEGGGAGSDSAGSGGASGGAKNGGSGGEGGSSGGGGSGDSGASGSGGLAGDGGAGGTSGDGGADGGTSGSSGSSGEGGSAGSSGQAGEGGGGGSTGDCASGDDCADDEPCNGIELCKSAVCEPGQALNNGTACQGQGQGQGVFFCQNAKCVESTCGDKTIDVNAGEECDDGNDDDTDGCRSDCKFTCNNDVACSDNEVCNGVELCVSHLCAPGTKTKFGETCAGSTPDSHICDGKGQCVASICGDGYFDQSTEECEEAGGPNGNDADGCTDECRFSCKVDEHCTDTDLCDGTETCDVSTHTCKEGDPLVCADTFLCTTNERCEPDVGCLSDLVDKDKDGFPPNLGEQSCTHNGKFFSGTWWDCNDEDKEAIPNRTYYADCDGDGFTPQFNQAVQTQSCGWPANPPPNCAKGKWFAKATALRDCNDNKGTNPAFFRPGQTEYSSDKFGGPDYDFNCDGTEFQNARTPANERACVQPNCSGTGWVGDGSIPRCGETGSWFSCGENSSGPECLSDTVHDTKQECL